jgi:AraC-like DNA-binding protein
MEACFRGHAFDPHRHDTYAIGFTMHGVQSFKYRGSMQHSVPGQVFVLHPDETHDGHAGTSTGFRYRLIYVDPSAIRDALGGTLPLPFVRETVSDNRALAAAIRTALGDLDLTLEDLHSDQIIQDLADALAAADRSLAQRTLSAPHRHAAAKARDYLDANVQNVVGSAELEAVTGLSRYALARHFRACLGTSPYRYLIMRRLDRARSLIRHGTPLVDAALSSGFSDQSHMTRHFHKAHGMSPGRWATLMV